MPVRPPALVPGNHIRILSPSGPVTEELVQPGVDVLRSWDLRVSLDHRTFARERYLAGNDAERAAALNDAIRDPEVDAVVFSRGGYGAMRILDVIDWSAFSERPKLLCGFSDITAIHLAALRHTGVITVHGPVVKSFDRQREDLQRLREALFGEPRARVHGVDVVRATDEPVRGHAVGGNLSLIAAMLASPHMPTLDGAVLFIEDVGEDDYRLDRLFTVLRLAPSVRNVAAIVLGDFVDCGGVYVDDADIPAFVRQLGDELGEALQVPVVAGFPFGHGDRNVPLFHGAAVTVDTEEGRVRFEDPAST